MKAMLVGLGLATAAMPGSAAERYQRAITIDTTAAGAGVRGDVKAYPLALSLTGETFDFSQAGPDGRDVRVVGPSGAELPCAIEHWDAAGRTAVVWVKADIKGDAVQELTLQWGHPKAASRCDPTAVFDTKDGFVGVWHLAEEGNVDADGYRDATGNAAHGTGVNMTAATRAPGRVGHGVVLRHAEQQWIKVENDKRKLFDLTTHMTFSIWARADAFKNRGAEKATPGYETMMAKGDNSWRLQMFGVPEWHKPPAQLLEICVEKEPKGDLCVVGTTDMKTGQWYHFTGVHDHPKARFYVNGVLEKEDTFDFPWVSGDHPVGLGNQSQWPVKGGRFWDGALDEARVMSVVKDEHWIKLEYESQREGQKLVRLGPAKKR